MHKSQKLPQLTFPTVAYGVKETPWNLTTLAYKGAGTTRVDLVEPAIMSGAFGLPCLERIELLMKFHEEINGALASGCSRDNAYAQYRYLRNFYGFADNHGHALTVEHVTETYCAWADWLFHRTRTKREIVLEAGWKRLSMRSAYNYAATVGTLLDKILNRHTNIIELTRLIWKRSRKSAIGVQAEKQNLAETFAFGHLLQDICDGLTLVKVRESPLPVAISLRSGISVSRSGDPGWTRGTQHEILGERYPLANLRVEAELLMFIGQTGMNLAQASGLSLRHFFYVSHLDGYQVKDHKARRGGAVLFEIFKDYKPHFERYLAWRRELFPDHFELFPFIRLMGTRADARGAGARLRALCKELGITFVGPRALRNTRVNWLLRKSSDPDLTAEMAQHTKETLLVVYERPSLQRTMVEATRFWSVFDPSIAEAVAPGSCTGVPNPAPEKPKEAPGPDCTRPSGCLWCENHRDIDSFNHVWALASFSELKAIELGKSSLPGSDGEMLPSKIVIDRIHSKLKWFEQSSETRREWVAEASARVQEGDYHQNFRTEIEELLGA